MIGGDDQVIHWDDRVIRWNDPVIRERDFNDSWVKFWWPASWIYVIRTEWSNFNDPWTSFEWFANCFKMFRELYISGSRAFWKKIFCLCHIKICCFYFCMISHLLLAFLRLKEVLDFVRKFFKPTFASPHLTTWWFPMNPVRRVWSLHKEGRRRNNCHI